MNYTVHQQAAIEARGEDLLISAAAGSGKTRVLVDRIVHMLRHDRAELSHMLIVTFTNAAAGEMKARLRQGLTEAVGEAEGEERAHLIAQLEVLQEAHISTMHAFCIAELRRFYHVLGLDPAFKILPEATNTILREEALGGCFDAFYESGDENFLRLVEAYGGRNDDESLRDLVRGVYARIQAQTDPLGWLDAQAQAYTEPLPEAYVRIFNAQVTETCDLAEDLLTQAAPLADLLPNAEKFHEVLADDAAVVRGIRHCIAAEDPLDALMTYLPTVGWRSKPRKPKNATDDEQEIDARIAGLRKQIKTAVEALSKLTIEGGSARIVDDRALVQPHLSAFATLVRAYDTAFKGAKQARSGLDFNDLEHAMLHLLADARTREAIRQEIGYIFFDEYQDANPIQEAIVEALASPGRLFFVGDVKQAIYRFRRADPNIFNRRYARYRDGDDGRLIFLAENFRSRPEILHFANALFDSLMTPTLGEVDYREPGQSLVCGASFEADAEAVQCVGVAQDSEPTRDAEAEWIAEEIERLVAAGRYGYGDMVVLMRSPTKRLRAFEDAFKARHIPYYSDNSVVGFENLEVRLFIAMLTVLANESTDTALLSALLSPFGGLSDEELAAIRLHTPEGPFSAAAHAYADAHQNETSRKLLQFYAHIADWRAALRYEPLAEVALRMFAESGYEAFLLGMDEGSERQQNVIAFIDTIAEYERDNRYGLPGFLHYVETLKARKMDSSSPGIGLSENDRCVRIMSIHKSKGLGFPVVFLADMARQFNFADSKPALVVDDALGAAMNVVDLAHGTIHASFEKRMLAAKNRDETLSEEVRLLYVALTRAIDRLYLVATFNDKAWEKWQEARGQARVETATFRGYRCYRDWLMTCLSDPRHALSLDARVPLYKWQFVAQEEKETETEKAATGYESLLAQADPALTAEIAARFSRAYAYADETTLPFKKTVSQLAKSNTVMPDYVQDWPAYTQASVPSHPDAPVPAFIQEHLSFTGAALGTLMHQVVQWLPLVPQGRDAIIHGLDRLVEEAFLTPEERAAVDIEMLVRFYESDFVRHLTETARDIEREVSFTMQLGETMVDGQIDMFFETEAGYEIVDFKTDRAMNAARYREQLALYAQALSAARERSVVHKWLFWLRFGKAEEV